MGWLRVLCEATIGYPVLCTRLLWRVRQCWCHDVCGRDADVQFPDFEARGQEEVPLWGPQQWPPGDKNEQKISSLPSSLPIYLPPSQQQPTTTTCDIKTSTNQTLKLLSRSRSPLQEGPRNRKPRRSDGAHKE